MSGGEVTNERAERAILSHAEAYRLVGEAREMRERAEQAEAERDALREMAGEMLDDATALLAHYRRHTAHRCEIDRDAAESLDRLRALLDEGHEEWG